MVIAVARITLHIPQSQSLKDKRQVVKSLLAQVQRKYLVAAAEVEEQDRHQTGVLGLVCVSNDVRQADAVLAKAVAFLDQARHDVEFLDYQTEVMHVF